MLCVYVYEKVWSEAFIVIKLCQVFLDSSRYVGFKGFRIDYGVLMESCRLKDYFQGHVLLPKGKWGIRLDF